MSDNATSPYAAITAGILLSAGVAHFLSPKLFDSLVPSWMPGDPRTTTYLSGVAEFVSGALVLHPRTRRLGGWAALTTFAAVYPANVWAAIDGGMKDAPPPFNSPAAAWLRLPFQLPLFWLAHKVVKGSATRK
jgi:uncharacterized membrane protein